MSGLTVVRRRKKPDEAPTTVRKPKKAARATCSVFRTPGILAATASGVMWFTATATFDLWPLAWVAAVPMLWAIERAQTVKRAAFFGWWTGLVTNAGGFYWIIGLLDRFAHLPWPVSLLLYLMLAGYQALVFLLFAWFVALIRRRSPALPMALVAPVVMVTFELFVPFIFPWYLAINQAWQPHVIQIADLGGPLAVTALLMTVGGAIYDLLTQGPRRLASAAVTAALLAGSLAYGHWRIREVDAARAAAPVVPVGLVQPNVAFNEKGVEQKALARQQLTDLQRVSQVLEKDGAELLVWTESSYPYAIPRDLDRDTPADAVGHIRRGFTAPLLFGAVTFERKNEKEAYNSALMLDRDGRFKGRFDKIFLMMFGEYVPGLETFPWIRHIIPDAAGQFKRGEKTTSFPFTSKDGKSYRLGPMICYEDILPGFGRKLAVEHPHLLVNITNDAWFGDTSEPWQHLALSVFRSVEMRTDMVRAVNTGVSAHIDAVGRVVARTYAVDPAVNPRGVDKLLVRPALMEGGHTIYARIGDVFAYACVAITLLCLFVSLGGTKFTTVAKRPKR